MSSSAIPADHMCDSVVLDATDRYRRRILLTSESGARFLLEMPHAIILRHGDGLMLDDGSIICIVGKPEPLIEIAAEEVATLIRLAWHLGNRHTEVEVVGGKLRMRRDHVLEEMLIGLGAVLTPIEAPFEPERGAYEHGHESEGDGRG